MYALSVCLDQTVLNGMRSGVGRVHFGYNTALVTVPQLPSFPQCDYYHCPATSRHISQPSGLI
jgi:hypothetical protein